MDFGIEKKKEARNGADFHENAKNGNFISNEKDLFLKVAKEIDILYKYVIFPMERTDNMTAYPQMTAEERKAEYARLQKEFDAIKAQKLSLNMARGKPGKAQLDMVSDVIFNLMEKPEDFLSGGIDVRNYGEMSGLPAAKELFAEILGCRSEQVFVGGNASLQLMYDTISKAYTHGLLHSPRPWCREETIKWLCPAPGYDRHFMITESFGFEMITIPRVSGVCPSTPTPTA